MRILIGNHIDASIRTRKDMRSWTQRILWFARDGDVIVLPAVVDDEFIRYLTGLTGTDPASLRICVPPPGPSGDHLLDPQRLADPSFVRQVAAQLGEVSEVFALWPSAQVSRFADELGVGKAFAGSAFFAQGGGEIVNNKANFRALAAAAGVPTARGEVVRTPEEAVEATQRLLATTDAVVVKQAHNGAGSGNEVLVRGNVATAHAGTKHRHDLAPGPDGVHAYWLQRWDWASAGGKFPVVVEEFRQRSRSVYAEFDVTNDGVRHTETGTLYYVDRWLSHQVIPLRDLEAEQYIRLVSQGERLAEIYRAVGYRGYLSPDAVVDDAGDVIFTEVNAQVSGSAHLWGVIGHQVVDVRRDPQRSVVEYHWPKRWTVTGFSEFLSAVHNLGYRYDHASRTGVIVSTPFDPLRGVVFAVVYDTEHLHDEIHLALETRFTRGDDH